MDEKKSNSNDYIKSNCTKKKKILYLIVISFIILVIITMIIVIGYHKFNWFKKANEEDDKDIYDLNIKIKSSVNQVDYFSETKKIKSKVAYTSGESDEQEQIIITNFAVFITDKTTNGNNNTNSTNFTTVIKNSTLVILDSTVKFRENETNLSSFDIFDEKQVKEFESNPNGTIYPMSKFSFFENGTILDIYLPENLDQYSAQVMLELINNVVPKLSRNRKEDKTKGLSLTLKKISNRDTLTIIQAQRNYVDKFIGEEYKGSKFKKITELDVENEKIKKVTTNTNLILETQKESKETLDFGIQNFNYDIASEIKLTKNEENKKENIQLVKKLSEKIKFIKSDDLMKTLILKEFSGENEDFEKTAEENEEIEIDNSKQARKFGWEGSISQSWTLANSNILGKKVLLQYEITLSDGELSNTLSATCGNVTLYFGNIGTTINKNKPEKSTGDKQLFKIPFPGSPIPIIFSFKICGDIGFNVYYDTNTNQFSVSFTGELYAKAELDAGVIETAEIDIGAKGTLISLTAESTLIKKSEYYTSSNSIIASGGAITCYITGKLFGNAIFTISKNFLKGWSKILY